MSRKPPSLRARNAFLAVLGTLLLGGCVASVSLADADADAADYIARQSAHAVAELAPDPATYSTRTYDWTDASRNRAVPVRVYLPATAGSHPLVVISHGIGGSREGYRYLGRHFAANGYVAMHVQHVGSDRQIWMGNPLGLLGRLSGAAQETEALERVADLKFALDRLLEGEVAARVDPTRIAVAGHSYGANTAMLVAGARVEREGKPLVLADPRIRAAILISAPPFYGMKDTRGILGQVPVPTLHITAQDDDITIPGYRSGLSDRLDVFASMGAVSQAPKVLAVFKGGAHSMFTDRIGPGGPEVNPIVKTATRELALMFANRVLARDESRIADWRQRHAPLIARFEQGGAL